MYIKKCNHSETGEYDYVNSYLVLLKDNKINQY
jgi:hypothetical protein